MDSDIGTNSPENEKISFEDLDNISIKVDKSAIQNKEKFAIQVVSNDPPFENIATIFLHAMPCRGDDIFLPVFDNMAKFRVISVFFFPNREIQNVIGCIPVQRLDTAPTAPPSDAQNRKDEIIRFQEEAFKKSENFANIVVLLGFGGVFGIWSFEKDNLSQSASLYSALFIGAALIAYMIYTAFIIISSSVLYLRFNYFVSKNPADFFKAFDNFTAEQRRKAKSIAVLWFIQIIITVGCGFSGAFLLLYNIFAKLSGLPQFPK